ncbi:hypothetical protein BDR03DRAFT_946236, partial [Suillus americanus]
HDHDVIHGDPTNTNVLVAADGSPRLADFGTSHIMIQSHPAFAYHTGAVRWVAPELLDPPEDQPIQRAQLNLPTYTLSASIYGKRPYWWIKSAIHVVSAEFKHEVRPSVEEVINYLQEALSNETLSV